VEQREIGALNRSALQIMSKMDSDGLLNTIIQEATNLLDGKSAGIFKYHAIKGDLELVADWKIEPTLRGHTLKAGEGLAGQVVRERKTKIVDDYDTWPERSERVDRGMLKAVIAAPLLMRNDVLGVLFVSDDKPGRTFEPHDIHLLDILASYAAIAMSKSKSLVQLKVLDEINLRLSTAMTLKEILLIALEEILKAIGTDEGSIMSVNREAEQLEFQHWIVGGKLKENLDRKLALGEGIAGHVARTGVPYNCVDTDHDPYFVPSFTGRPIMSLLCVPIISRGRVTYIINADGLTRSFFTTENAHFLSAIAGRVAVAIESQNLRDIGAQLSTLPLEEMLHKIAQSSCALTGIEAATIFLKDRLSNDFRREASYPVGKRMIGAPRPDGLTNLVLNSGRPLKITNAQDDGRVRESVRDEGVQLILGVPLTRGETLGEDTGATASRAIGVLFLNSRHSHEHVDEALGVLKVLASYASVAIENAWLIEAKSHRAEMLDSLHRASLEITTQLPVPELGALVLDRAVEFLQADGGVLYLADEEKKTFRATAVSNFPEEYRGTTIKIGKSLVSEVIKEGEARVRLEYHEWEHRLRLFDEYRLTTVAAAPIQWKGDTHGAIVVHHVTEGRTFSPEDLDLLSHLGNLAAVALANARQTDDLKRVMDSSFDAVIAVNEKGKIVRMNDRAKIILGRENENMEGQDVRPLYYYPDDARAIKARLSINEDGTENKEGKLTDYFTYLRGSGDEKIPIMLSASVLLDYDGKRAGSVGFFQDHDKQQKSKREVRVLQSLLATSRVVASTTSLTEALDAICEEVIKSLEGVHSVTLYLYDPTVGKITVPPTHIGVEHTEMWTGPIRPDSPVMKAIELGQAQFIEDAGADDSIVKGDFVRREGIKSCVAAPLKVGNKTIGVMFLNYTETHRFSVPEQEITRIFARNVAIVVENASLYEKSRLQADELSEIRKQKSILSTLNTEDVSLTSILREIVDQARQVTTAELGALSVLDAHGSIQEFITSGVEAEAQASMGKHPIGVGVLGLLLKNDEIINESDITTHVTFQSFPPTHPLIDSFLGLPIKYRGKIIGSLYTGNKKDAQQFNKNDESALSLLAAQAAIAIENARLFETTEKSLRETAILQEQTKSLIHQAQALQQTCFKLAEADDPRDLLNHLIQLVMELKNAESGTVLFYDPKCDDFTESLRCNELGQSLEPYQTTVTREPGKDPAYEIIHGGPRFISNIKADEQFSRVARKNWHSMAGLPLKGKEGPVGVLYINWDEPHDFASEEREWLLTLAEQASSAIDSYRSRETFSATQNINLATLLFSHWFRKVEEARFALHVDLRSLTNLLPVGVFATILTRMSVAISEPMFSVKDFLHIGSENERVDLKALIQNVAQRLSEGRNPIKTRLNLPDEPCIITGNEALIKTATEILIENAIVSTKGSSEPGEITIDMAVSGDIARARISDNGVGISPEILRAFYRSSKDAEKGYGYFLAATILKKHTGDMRVVKTDDQGTTIEFWLPIAEVTKNANAQGA
jgi:PAS domain S-box-containing protein